MSKIKPEGLLPHKSFYPLDEAATLAGCKVSDLVHYAGQNRISLVIGVPDWVVLRVYDENTRELCEPFLLIPSLLSLSPAQCLKIEFQGRTQASDFLSGFLMESDGGLKELFPNYGRKDLGRQWVFWRLMEDGNVCLLDLIPDRLFVTRDDLLALMGEGDESPVSPPPVRKEKKFRASTGWNVDVTGTGREQVGEPVDQTAGGQEEPVVPENRKTVAAETKKSTEPVEAAPKPSPRGSVILRLKQVMERTGLSRSTIYDRMNPNSPRHDPSFPRQLSLGGDAVGWAESAIDNWVQSRIVARRS